MNNETIPSPSDFAQTVYEGIVETQAVFGSLVLLIYASLFSFPDELEYIWKPKFTLPTFLYLCSRYAVFFHLIVSTAQEFGSLSLCNTLGYLDSIVVMFAFTGVQGLTSIRAYALCQRSRSMAIALSVTFLISLGFQFYELTVPACGALSSDWAIWIFIASSVVALSDMLAFAIVIRQIWGVWKLKQDSNLQSNQDLVTLLLQQGFLRFSFVLLMNVTAIVLLISNETSITGNCFTIFQNVLSALLMCELTIDLRRRNAQRSISNSPILSFRDNAALSIRSALGRFHESIVAEMGERNDPVGMDLSTRSEESVVL